MNLSGVYFFEWGELRKLLRKGGLAPADCDARRHAIHAEVLGADKSHTKFTDREMNAVLKRFRELSGSLNTKDYDRGARIYVIREICRGLGKPDPDKYAQGIVDQMDSEGRLSAGPHRRAPDETAGEFEMSEWDAELRRDKPKVRRLMSELTPEDLDKVIIALRKQAGRIERAAKVRRVGDFKSAKSSDLECLYVQTPECPF
ncbi:MAG TPA: hypothetical protein VK474_00830 [Chthoniobacterales bacterium]|nr:hypothetical protein [Chthoniobacterales bacterium]